MMNGVLSSASCTHVTALSLVAGSTSAFVFVRENFWGKQASEINAIIVILMAGTALLGLISMTMRGRREDA